MLEFLAHKSYLVHGFNLDSTILKYKNFRKRDNIVHYSKAMQYDAFDLKGMICFVNTYGSVIVLQPLVNIDNHDEALDIYNSEAFYEYYNLFKSIINSKLKIKLKDSDFTFLLVDSNEETISWSIIKTRINNEISITLLIESLFIFLLCNFVQSLLTNLPFKQNNSFFQKKLVQTVEDLFSFEHPSYFLVNNDEIVMIKKYYKGWNIGTYVKSLKDRFSQSITNSTFYQNYKDKQRSKITNTLLATIAVLSLNSSTDIISNSFTFLSKEYISKIVIVLGTFLVFYAVGSFIKFYISAISHYINNKLISDKIIKNIDGNNK